MFPVIGLVVLIGLVFGGFAFTGGNLTPVLEAMPHEMLIIGGAAIGALIIGNSGGELKALMIRQEAGVAPFAALLPPRDVAVLAGSTSA